MTLSIELDFKTFPSTLFGGSGTPTTDQSAARQAVQDAANAWAMFVEDDFEAIPAGIFSVTNPKTVTVETG